MCQNACYTIVRHALSRMSSYDINHLSTYAVDAEGGKESFRIRKHHEVFLHFLSRTR